jgi:phage terminase large subunit
MTIYQIIETTEDIAGAYQPYGSAADLWMCKKPEIILSGPAETGKTLAALHKIDALAWKYPKAHIAMIRKTRQSMDASVLKTYQDNIKHPNIFTYGGHKPQWFDYPNKSRIVIGGMDNPNKILSAEYDMIYVNQAEELTLDDWEKLLTRATGRAGHTPYAQIIGDCNPGPNSHWILQRKQNSNVTFFESRHEDNPTLFNPLTGEITEQGRRTMAVLDSLSGVRYQRLRLGKWVSAEGQIYDNYDAAVHLIDRFDIPNDWRRIRVIDFGLVHPFICQWWAIDGDGRAYRYREIYMTGRTVKTHAEQINELSEGEQIEQTICDHDAEDRQTLAENGIPNIAAKKDVLQGIGRVQDRLKKQIDDKPRLYLLRDSLVEVDQSLTEFHLPTCTEDEIDSYIWQNSAKREQPVKENDHGCDCIRYLTMHLDGGSQWRSIKFLKIGQSEQDG